jgi:hypothetical protein
LICDTNIAEKTGVRVINRRVGLAGWILPLAIIGCSGGSGGGPKDGSAGAACDSPGTSYSCSRGTCEGTQLCTAAGKMTPCDCSTAGTTSLLDSGHVSAGDASLLDAGHAADSGKPADGSVKTPPDAGHGGAAGGAAGAAAADSGTHVIEDCGNGVDDDGDGKIDCADEDCAARTCLADAPAGWSGPTVLYVGSEKAPACGGAYPSEALRGGLDVSAPAAECSACSCTQAAPGCSSFLGFGMGTQADCSDAACKTQIDSSCVELVPSCLNGLATAYVQTQLPPSAMSCMPSAPQSPMIADPAFMQHVLACGSSDLRRGGCSPGNVCAPEGPFTGPYCIVQPGDLACPAGPYSDKRVYFTAIDDKRDCSACSCGSDCSYTWKIFDDADATCQTPLGTKTSAGECVVVTPSSGKIRVGAAITGTGTCAASGGQPTGSATANSPVTACCKP